VFRHHRRKLVVIADVILVGLAVVAVYRLCARGSRSPAAPEPQPLRTGVRLSLGSGPPMDSKRHVVLRISTTCPGTNSSVAFFRDVLARARAAPATMVTVLASEPKAVVEDWLRRNNLDAGRIEVVRSPSQMGLLLIPTSVITDGDGVVTDLLIGAPSQAASKDFLDRVSGSANARPVDNSNYGEEVSLLEAERRRAKATIAVLDLRPRAAFESGHLTGAMNIPRDELAVRLPKELPSGAQLALDCRQFRLRECRVLARALGSDGAAPVLIITK